MRAIKMKVVYYSILIYVLQLPPKSHCGENNVCKTIRDYYTIKDNPNCEYDIAADPKADPITVIQYYGYPAELHHVTTEDGYILSLFRIPNDHATHKNGPVLLQHGVMNSGSVFLGLRNHSLAFLLADAGYDVWLGNKRGSEYSEGHVNLTVHDKKFWDYSRDEYVLYDTPAELDYISKVTDYKERIVYMGYSLGSAAGLIYSSTFPEKARRTLKMLVLIAPGVYLSNMKSPSFQLTRFILTPLYKFLLRNDLIRLVSQAKVLKWITRTICLESPLLLQRCAQLLAILVAGPKSQTDPKTYAVVANQNPAGASFKIHSQTADSILGNFRRHDYGRGDNFQRYGTNNPPSHDIGRNEVPVFAIHARNDWVVTPTDVRNMYNDLSPAVRYGRYEIEEPYFNHVDFMYGRNAKYLVYDVILKVIHRI